MKNIFRLSNLRIISTLLAISLAIPFSWKGLSGFYAWMSPFIMLNSVFSLKSFVWLNTVALIITLFVLLRKRWFCHHLCPVGLGCDMVSGLSQRKSSTYNKLPHIGEWFAIISMASAIIGLPLFIFLDPLAIFNGFFTIFTGKLNLIALLSFSAFPLLLLIHIIFPGVWCAKLCPLGGFQLLLAKMKTQLGIFFGKEKPDPDFIISGRRYFIMSGIGLISGAAIPKILKAPSKCIRPPGAVEPLLFNSICCRCGNCIKTCPTDILLPNTDFGNIMAWMTPEVRFKNGYCLESCNMCSRDCPTGAITLFSVKAKSQLIMGTAKVNPENCLLVHNIECIKCVESCKYDAIKFVAEVNILNAIPVADIKKCVGCGACAVICPVSCIEIDHPE